MNFSIERERNILDMNSSRYNFHGSFSERELVELKLAGVAREIFSDCRSASDYLLALEVIYRKHKADRTEAGDAAD